MSPASCPEAAHCFRRGTESSVLGVGSQRLPEQLCRGGHSHRLTDVGAWLSPSKATWTPKCSCHSFPQDRLGSVDPLCEDCTRQTQGGPRGTAYGLCCTRTGRVLCAGGTGHSRQSITPRCWECPWALISVPALCVPLCFLLSLRPAPSTQLTALTGVCPFLVKSFSVFVFFF